MPEITPARHGRHTPRRRTRPARRLIGAVALALLVAPAAAFAQAAVPKPASERQPLPAAGGSQTAVTSDWAGSMLRLGIGLIVVVALILGVWFLMKRLQRRGMPGMAGRADELVDVVSTTPLGPNRFLHLIRVGEELVLVGATEHSVTPVARIGADEAIGMLGETLEPEQATQAFRSAQERPTGGDPRVRAAATARQSSVVERLRALTTRK